MRRIAPWILLFAIGATATLSAARTVDAEPAREPPCVAFWPEARYVIGYDHVVHLYNQCLRDATCSVRTDVNPEPQTVEVPAGEHVQVVTWRGSPASRFTAYVDCTLAPG
jgi:hypothetical protein